MLKVAAAAVTFLALGASIAGPATAGPWEDGQTVYERHDYVTAARFGVLTIRAREPSDFAQIAALTNLPKLRCVGARYGCLS
jgi:hypothetical protein